ncbi:phage portal protein [Embleya sp. NPDC005971]|uniref:phage portal protein n=1 Tax=Embleya sp. NPDC005971 TaxID=3156724 RepID=UPI003405C02B
MAKAPVVESPEWWRDRLYKKLDERREYAACMRRYYDGDPPLSPIADKAHSAFRRLLKQSRLNVAGLVVDATVERMKVDGIRLGDAETGDPNAWRIWQANNLDGASAKLIAEAVKVGRGFMLVAPNPRDPSTPIVTPEDMTQAIVDYRPGYLNERAAGLKTWIDDWTGLLMATVYLPAWIYKFQAEVPKAGLTSGPRWVPRNVEGEPWPAPNPLGVVPLIEIQAKPDLLGNAFSELHDVLDVQDRINKTLIDRMMAQEFSAFRQRWMTGYELPTDENGQTVEPFASAVDRLWVVEDETVKFGEFESTDLRPYLLAVEADVQHMAARTRTPSQYLLGSMANVSGDSLKAAESGLVSKVRQRMDPVGEGVEEFTRTYLRAAGDTRPTDAIEVIWRNPEFRTEGELVDALVKMSSLGVPREALWERWGASQTEIARWRILQTDAAARVMGGDLASLLGPKPPLTTAAQDAGGLDG